MDGAAALLITSVRAMSNAHVADQDAPRPNRHGMSKDSRQHLVTHRQTIFKFVARSDAPVRVADHDCPVAVYLDAVLGSGSLR